MKSLCNNIFCLRVLWFFKLLMKTFSWWLWCAANIVGGGKINSLISVQNYFPNVRKRIMVFLLSVRLQGLLNQAGMACLIWTHTPWAHAVTCLLWSWQDIVITACLICNLVWILFTSVQAKQQLQKPLLDFHSDPVSISLSLFANGSVWQVDDT